MTTKNGNVLPDGMYPGQSQSLNYPQVPDDGLFIVGGPPTLARRYKSITAAVAAASEEARQTGAPQTVLIYPKDDGTAYDEGPISVSESLSIRSVYPLESNKDGNTLLPFVEVLGGFFATGEVVVELVGMLITADQTPALSADLASNNFGVLVRRCAFEGADNGQPLIRLLQGDNSLSECRIRQHQDNPEACVEVGGANRISIAAIENSNVLHRGRASATERWTISLVQGTFSQCRANNVNLSGPVELEANAQFFLGGADSALITQEDADPCIQIAAGAIAELYAPRLRTEGVVPNIIDGAGSVFSGNCVIDRFSTSNSVAGTIAFTDLTPLT